MVLFADASSGFGRIAARPLADRGARMFGASRRAHPDDAGTRLCFGESVRR
ncbi:hypothetical protein [Streptomyces sp. NBC_00996]|uniref:hypothetical protein n=1 Tax=Streptomyces sp. NBC_00996 TaxID=2903710 RepID=UPI003866B0D2|nr:hypothetical protein OG390_43785 [Streptomyces sp. NBC_00996]